MKRIHIAVISGQLLSFLLMVTFIYANKVFGFLMAWEEQGGAVSWYTAHVAACLVGIVGAASIWISWYYLTKSNSMRDMLVVCAWTRQVKSNGQWISFDRFLSEQLGYAISHGLSDEKLVEMKAEIDRDWRKGKSKLANPGDGKKAMGFEGLPRKESGEPCEERPSLDPSVRHSLG